MANLKNPVANIIPLLPIESEEFYAVIIPEESKRGKWNNIWVFCKGCEIAQYSTGSLADNDDPRLTPDGIKALDGIGQFGEIKEFLIESK